ncbi:MAG: PilZ domain-containing protein [Acidobacteriota bacterium]|nr:PilZ domain-containing protein [Acidobacteriota bacterium]MDE3265548.1 PilZ domain-containing protein [Acidobacteriota bacterium]
MSPASQSFRFRESRRLLREVPVRLSVSGEDGELVAQTRDIAIGGMFVATSDVRPVGTGAAFVLELGSGDAPDTVQGDAAVVWVREAPGGADQPAGMGMQFTRVEPPGEERLAMLFSEPPDETAGSDAPAAAPSPVAEEVEKDVAEETEAEETEAEDDTVDEAGEGIEEPAEPAVENEAQAAEPVDPGEAAEEPLPDEAASPEEPATGDGEVGDTRAELFGDLAGDQDDWMNRESERPSWVWPTVAGVILVGLLLIFVGRPLMRLVGIGGDGAEEQPAPVPQSFEVAAPVEEPARPVDPPAAAQPSAESVPGPAAAEVPERATPSPERAAPPPEQAASPPERAAPPPEPAASSPEPVVRPRPPAPAQSSPAPSARPVNATALRAISASVQDDRTLVEITGNAPFERHHVMLLEAPPRLLVRLVGVQRDYDASAVSAPRLRGVRTGVHGRGATRNLHVVLDLASPDIVARVERRGDRVVVHLSD